MVLTPSHGAHSCSFLQYGDVEEMNVCDNLGDHLVGNVYIKFRFEEDAEKAVTDLNNRWYNGKECPYLPLVVSSKKNTIPAFPMYIWQQD